MATAGPRPTVPTRRTECPLRRIACAGWNSGQIRCTEAMAVRSRAPCGPDRSSLAPVGGTPGACARRGRGTPSAGDVRTGSGWAVPYG
ncbi:hypothetical protein GCM10010420_44540 [Streptomyces glaucosporus]|uniref:Uncharacterized protein n=1 Tax=Streptomyces glaucosporus TaxID=284044 RepID=A0ABP5VX11_9ACTN